MLIMESDYTLATSRWFTGVTLASTGGHVQSLLSGYKRINILLNPESSQGRAKAAAQYSPLHLSLLFGTTILELSSFFASLAARWSKGRRRGEEGEGGRKMTWGWRLMCWLGEERGQQLHSEPSQGRAGLIAKWRPLVLLVSQDGSCAQMKHN